MQRNVNFFNQIINTFIAPEDDALLRYRVIGVISSKENTSSYEMLN